MNKESRLLTPDFCYLAGSRLFFFAGNYTLLVILPLLLVDRGASTAVVGMVMGIPGLVSLVVRPMTGRLSDRFGFRTFLWAGALITAAVTPLYYLIPVVYVAFILRAVHGISTGMYFAASLAGVAQVAPPSRRGEAFSYFLLLNTVSLGVVTPLALYLRAKTGDAFTLGVTTLAPLLAALGVFLTSRSVKGASGEALDGFGRLLLRPRLAAPLLVNAVAFILYGGLTTFVVLFARERGIEHAGLFFLGYSVTATVIRSFIGRISDRIGRKGLIFLSLTLSSLAVGSLPLVRTSGGLAAVGVLYALGFAASTPLLVSSIVDAAGPRNRGTGVGLYGGSCDVGLAAGPALMGALAGSLGYEITFIMAGVAGVAVLALYAVLLRLPATAQEEKTEAAARQGAKAAGAGEAGGSKTHGS